MRGRARRRENAEALACGLASQECLRISLASRQRPRIEDGAGGVTGTGTKPTPRRRAGYSARLLIGLQSGERGLDARRGARRGAARRTGRGVLAGRGTRRALWL